jgi:serine/threonine protein kinase
MGVTYKAMDVNLHLPVALKVINPRYSAQPDARARFLREARAAARLRHPNVASVFHYGTLDRSSEAGGEEECFYAMEFIDGETLESRVRRDGALNVEAALQMALQVAQALAAAENAG